MGTGEYYNGPVGFEFWKTRQFVRLLGFAESISDSSLRYQNDQDHRIRDVPKSSALALIKATGQIRRLKHTKLFFEWTGRFRLRRIGR